MKKLSVLLFVMVLIFCFTACDRGAPLVQTSDAETDGPINGETTEIVVFAAASMTETLDQIIVKYQTVEPEVTVTATYDSSGALKTQIQQGASCDLFLSAGQLQMNQLDRSVDAGQNTEGLDLVFSDTRIDLLENKVTLAVADGNAKGMDCFDDMAEGLKDGSVFLAIGNSDVPVGQYTQKIFSYYGLDEEALAANGVLTYGSNVKEVTTQVAQGAVDGGIIYCTDAFSAGLTVTDYATADMCGRVIYPAAVMKNSMHMDAAQDFLDFLTTEDAMSVFESVGFSRVNAEDL